MISEKEIEQLYWEMREETDGVENGNYTKYYAHLKNVFQEAAKRNYMQSEHKNKIELPVFSENFIESFLGNIRKITMRTLIFEMELCADCGELKGKTDEEKYLDFADYRLVDPAYLKEIYAEYPLMYKDILRYLTLSVKNICEMLNRFEADLEGINSRFFKDNPCQKIVKIDGGNSDIHNGGGSVLILELDQGEKLVYKPRSLAMDEAYRTFLQWVCKNIDISYWWNEVWDRGSYGWCGLVTSIPCKSIYEMGRYYQRNGILLCISYLLGSGDIHYENLIAHGEYPVIIDLELAVGSRRINSLSETDGEVRKVFRESVLQTGILPLYAWNEDGEGVNVGAMNGGGGQLLPLDVPVIADAGTIRMHVEYRRPRLKEGKNLATLDGKFIQPTEFFQEIKKGFEMVYLFFEENKEEVAEKLKLFQGVQARYLVRQTQEYALLFTAMYHPNFLVVEKERSNLLNQKLCCDADSGTKEVSWIHTQEMEEMKRGDIPYFWYDPYESGLHSGMEEICENYFLQPVINEVYERLKCLKQVDMERQEKLMKMALFLGEKPVVMEKNSAIGEKSFAEERMKIRLSGVSNENYGKGLDKDIECNQIGVLMAEKIGEILLNEAIWADDRKSVGWISIMMAGYQERGYLIRPMGVYLYDGLAGIAVFMQRLAKETGKKDYEEIAELLIQKLFAYTENCAGKKQRGRKPTGAFSGEASIAFAYLLLYLADGKVEFLNYLKRQCETIAGLFSEDTHYDVLGGNAGAILVLLGAYEVTGDRQYIAWAQKAGEFLIESAVLYEWGLGWVNPLTKTALTGFAHGASGIMLALTKLGYYTGDQKYSDAAYRAFLFEEHYFDEKAQDWKDLRFSEATGHSMAWCHGWGGITMARMITRKYAKGKFQCELEKTAEAVLKRRGEEGAHNREGSYCLCHGKCGNAALYFANRKENVSRKLQGSILEDLKGYKEKMQDMFEMQECSNYGLMGGITGIGYSCLCGVEETARVLGICCL